MTVVNGKLNKTFITLEERIHLLRRAVAEFEKVRPRILHNLRGRPQAEQNRAKLDLENTARYLRDELDRLMGQTTEQDASSSTAA